MVDKVENKTKEESGGNGSKSPTVTPKAGFTPPVSVSATRIDPNKQKIASQLIEAMGDKLIELNYIMPGMLLDLIALDVLGFLQAHPDSTGDEILDYFRQSIYHHLRGHKGAFIRSVVDLAKEEYKINQNVDGGGYNII